MDFYSTSVLESELGAGEKIFWSGQPAPARLAAKQAWGVPIGILVLAFALFWTNGMTAGFTHTDAPSLVMPVLVGGMFLATALGFILAPIQEYRRARATIYAITDRRALVIGGGRGHSVRSWARADMGRLERRDRRRGAGDVIFAQTTFVGRKGARCVEEHGFFAIADQRRVEGLLRETFKT